MPARRHLIAVGLLAPFLGWRPAAGFSRTDERMMGRERWLAPGEMALLDLGSRALAPVEALGAVSGWRISPGSRVTLRFAGGVTRLAGRLRIEHPDGLRLRLVGAPGGSILEWEGEEAGLLVPGGHALGLLQGVTLRHNQASRRGTESGLLADEGGFALCGADVKVSGFYYGLTARRNGVIRGAPGLHVEAGGDANFFAFMGGHISARDSISLGAADPDRPLGSGFVAEYGGTIDAEGARASGNKLAGFTALAGGAIRAYRSQATHNLGSGYLVGTGGTIVAHGALAQGNCRGTLTNRGGRGHFEANGLRELSGACPG